jgi:hypothetical protein
MIERTKARRLEQPRTQDAETLRPRAAFVWAIVLLAFRAHGDCHDSRAKLTAACLNNPHVRAYLLGRKKPPRQLPILVGVGDETEAVHYAAENLDVWKTTNGALEWVAKRPASEQ